MRSKLQTCRTWGGAVALLVLFACGVSPEHGEGHHAHTTEEHGEVSKGLDHGKGHDHGKAPAGDAKPAPCTEHENCEGHDHGKGPAGDAKPAPCTEHENCEGHDHGEAPAKETKPAPCTEHENCEGHDHSHPAKPALPKAEAPDGAAFKARFVEALEARLAGDWQRFVSLFAPEGYNLDYKIPFTVKGKKIKSNLLVRSLEGTFPITVKNVCTGFDLSSYKLADLVDLKRLRVLGYEQAMATYRSRKAGRLSRIFYRGGFLPGDVFVIAPALKTTYAKGAVTSNFNHHFFVGLERAPQHLFYVFRRVDKAWKIVLYLD